MTPTPLSILSTMGSGIPESAAAGQPAQTAPSQTKAPKKTTPKQSDDALTTDPSGPETSAEEPPAAPAKKTASHGKKRKSDDTDSPAASAPPKKTKKETTKASPKPRQTRRTKTAEPDAPTPQAPSAVALHPPLVEAKLDTIKKFVGAEMAHEDSLLLRPDADHVSMPELDLVGVVMALHFHYQLGALNVETALEDIEDAITERFKKPVGSFGDVSWVTVNAAAETKLEQRIKEKVAGHGLEGVRLLEVEMELCARRQRAQARLYQWQAEKTMQTAKFMGRAADVGWEGMARNVEVELARDGHGDEKGRRGVCPAPSIEVA